MVRFPDEIGAVLAAANAEAAELKHDYIATEHVLLGLLRDDGGLPVHALRRLGVRPEDVRRELIVAVSRGDAPQTLPERRNTSWVNSSLKLAVASARQANEERVEPHHVLLGLIQHERGTAAEVLTSLGVSAAALMEVVRQIRDEGRS